MKENSESVPQERGTLSDRKFLLIQKFIRENDQEIYLRWAQCSTNGFYCEA